MISQFGTGPRAFPDRNTIPHPFGLGWNRWLSVALKLWAGRKLEILTPWIRLPFSVLLFFFGLPIPSLSQEASLEYENSLRSWDCLNWIWISSTSVNHRLFCGRRLGYHSDLRSRTNPETESLKIWLILILAVNWPGRIFSWVENV